MVGLKPVQVVRYERGHSWLSAFLSFLDLLRRVRVIFLIEFDNGSVPTGMPSAGGLSAIQRLKAAANLKPIKKKVILNNGDEFEFYHKPLTMAQRERAQKNAKGDDTGSFVLQLLVEVAKDEYGQLLFSTADIAELKHLVRDEDLQKLMLAVLSNENEGDDEGAPPVEADMKSDPKGAA